jgi:hypothetical protein
MTIEPSASQLRLSFDEEKNNDHTYRPFHRQSAQSIRFLENQSLSHSRAGL